jgi:3-methyl-2-oxobutanoate hydroxymethyltransferase
MRIALSNLQKMAQENNKIAMLTCYDASFAALLETAGVDCLLIGDSLGMVLQGEESTLPVSMADMIYHTRCVAKTSKTAFVIADMPFGSYQESPIQAFNNAARLMAAGAHMVKLEGGALMADTIHFLVERGIPVCGHLGLTPQSVHQLGGYKVQGKTDEQAQRLLNDAKLITDAGAAMMVLETIPAAVATRVTESVKSLTIGIGAGANCDGQVLVLHDMLDIYPGRKARFVKNFMHGAESIQAAVKAYVDAVKNGSFPAAEHTF